MSSGLSGEDWIRVYLIRLEAAFVDLWRYRCNIFTGNYRGVIRNCWCLFLSQRLFRLIPISIARGSFNSIVNKPGDALKVIVPSPVPRVKLIFAT